MAPRKPSRRATLRSLSDTAQGLYSLVSALEERIRNPSDETDPGLASVQFDAILKGFRTAYDDLETVVRTEPKAAKLLRGRPVSRAKGTGRTAADLARGMPDDIRLEKAVRGFFMDLGIAVDSTYRFINHYLNLGIPEDHDLRISVAIAAGAADPRLEAHIKEYLDTHPVIGFLFQARDSVVHGRPNYSFRPSEDGRRRLVLKYTSKSSVGGSGVQTSLLAADLFTRLAETYGHAANACLSALKRTLDAEARHPAVNSRRGDVVASDVEFYIVRTSPDTHVDISSLPKDREWLVNEGNVRIPLGDWENVIRIDDAVSQALFVGSERMQGHIAPYRWLRSRRERGYWLSTTERILQGLIPRMLSSGSAANASLEIDGTAYDIRLEVRKEEPYKKEVKVGGARAYPIIEYENARWTDHNEHMNLPVTTLIEGTKYTIDLVFMKR
ncbi:hypothetical protein JXB02_04490 [Candidatus Woesearchaeota archaeon]|nr:hypothetical protein [Candidatus Woesearchaeota archaeon]